LVVWNYEFKQVFSGPGSVIIQFQTQSFIKISSLFVHLKIKYSKYKVNIMKYKVVKNNKCSFEKYLFKYQFL